jgi:thiamine pyrophosphate-dependent acetolactate synthase large subunit-like protein
MNREELELTLSIAQRAGIALVDSLTHPGSVPKFYKGKLNRNYLGTLAAYGYNSRVYCYLHYNGKINPVSEQCLFFLKNKLTQVATPFSAGRLNRKLKIVQLTHNDRHISPFTNYPLVLNYRAFLQYVDKHLDISPKTRARRYQAMDAVVDTPSDVMSKLPKMPMSPNYFFARFNQVIERLIVQNDFDYTGVYDVGRCGLSAIRNVSRTRPGFSGWYGRALMGDALQAISSLAFTAHGNIIGFIGDGAKGVVPDVVPSLIENALSYQDMRKKNITIFFFLNGGHSVIRTYQERILFNRSSRQMRLINIFPQDWEEEICGIQIVSRVLDSFDASKLTSAMLKQGVINLFSVVVSHNNEGDGLSLATATGWQRDQDFASNHSSRKNVKSEQVIHEFQ